MVRKREARSAEFKAQVAFAAVAQRQTVAELVQTFSVHSTQVHAWNYAAICHWVKSDIDI